MAHRLRRTRKLKSVDAGIYIPQGFRPIPRTLVRASFKPFKDNDGDNEDPLPFGESYWDFLPDLVQNKIAKMVHKQFLKAVHAELLGHNCCPNCANYFENAFEMERHWLDECNGKYWWESNRDYACDCIPYCECEREWDDWWECEVCECCGRQR